MGVDIRVGRTPFHPAWDICGAGIPPPWFTQTDRSVTLLYSVSLSVSCLVPFLECAVAAVEDRAEFVRR